MNLLIVLMASALPAAVSDDSASSAGWLSTIPGATGDPVAGMILTSPLFTIPKLNRYPPLIEGMPQSGVGYLVDGCPVVFDYRSSGLLSLSEQSVYSGSSGSTGVSLTMPNHFSGPFFFDGYRSWFHGTSALDILQEHSYTPPEHGFFTGPMLSVTSTSQETVPLISSRIDNKETSLDASLPVTQSLILRGGGRFGYNGGSVGKWLSPYTWSGDYSSTPRYGDYNLSGIWRPSDRLDVRMHLIGAGERLALRSGDSAYGVSRAFNNHTITIGTAVNARLFSCLQSKTTASLTTSHGASEDSAARVFWTGTHSATTAVTITEKALIVTGLPVAPYAGIDARKWFGEIDLAQPSAWGTIFNDTMSADRFAMAPFAGMQAKLMQQWNMDFGLRYDFYRTDNTRHGSLLAVPPRYAVADSVNGNLCYRFRTTWEMPDHSRLSLISGTSSQLPSLYELDINTELSTIKSARHSLVYTGTMGFGTGYKFCGYFNQLWNIPEFSGVQDPTGELLQSNGRQRSRGVMAQLDHTFVKRLNMVFGYSISSCEMNSDGTSAWIRADGDRRHKFDVLLLGQLPFGFKCSVNCMATSGAPYTPIVSIIEQEAGFDEYLPVSRVFNSATGKPYCNLSASVSYARRFGMVSIKAFIEGANLLQPSEVNAVPHDDAVEAGRTFSSIDTRSILFGVNIDY